MIEFLDATDSLRSGRRLGEDGEALRDALHERLSEIAEELLTLLG